MSTLRQVAQQALEALEEINKLSIGEHAICLPGEIDTAMDALRAALAEPEQEPVAWVDDSGHPRHLSYVQGVREKQLYGPLRPLYTAPTPRNEPVIDKTMAKRIATQLGWEPAKKPLTEQEIQTIWAKTFEMGSSANTFARAIEKAHGIKEQEHE